ncbi:hypothetical protein [Nonomuraea sp. NPDC048916]|uniref:hypothetical protein n=1 Tax=Nonomuraea sp. NPDC048916 TaxID=3154232 RepID=UPI0033DF0C8A
MNPTNHETPAPGITVDGTGLLCVTLLLRLRKEIDGAEPGTAVLTRPRPARPQPGRAAGAARHRRGQ